LRQSAKEQRDAEQLVTFARGAVMSILQRDVIPFFSWFLLLVAAAIGVDWVLHQFDFVWIGRYLGIVGVFVILAWLTPYSLRKRKIIESGNPAILLRLHQSMGWVGAVLIVVHAGIHFNAILPWLALTAMLINVASGLTGAFLLRRARRRLEETRSFLLSQGHAEAQAEQELLWDVVTLDFLKKWRMVHLPITMAFGALALAHVVTILMFWGWR
jgi:hypothetical protein